MHHVTHRFLPFVAMIALASCVSAQARGTGEEPNPQDGALPPSVMASEVHESMKTFFDSLRDSEGVDMRYQLSCTEHCFPSHMDCQAVTLVSCSVIILLPFGEWEALDTGAASVTFRYPISLGSDHVIRGNVLDQCREELQNCVISISPNDALDNATRPCSFATSEVSRVVLQWDTEQATLVWSIGKMGGGTLATVAANDGRILSCSQ